MFATIRHEHRKFEHVVRFRDRVVVTLRSLQRAVRNVVYARQGLERGVRNVVSSTQDLEGDIPSWAILCLLICWIYTILSLVGVLKAKTLAGKNREVDGNILKFRTWRSQRCYVLNGPFATL